MKTIEAVEIRDIPLLNPIPSAQPITAPKASAGDLVSPQKFELRPYQSEPLTQIENLWAGGTKRILLQLATGSGKTVVFSTLINRLVEAGQTCLVLVHRKELMRQTANKVRAIAGIEPGMIKAGIKPNYDSPVQIAMVGSLINRLYKYPQFDNIVVDEAQHSKAAQWQQVIEHYGQSNLLGVSATPIRADNKGFTDIFDKMICGISMKELITQGHLSRYRYKVPSKLSSEGLKTRGGEYTRESIEAANSAEQVAADCLKAYQDHAMGKQTVIFASSVAYSREIAATFSANGIRSAHLDGEDEEELRDATMAAFEQEQIQVLCNCALFSEGLDVPGIDAVIIARFTKSIVFWLQAIGRALRPSPNKDHAIILDLGAHYKDFGLPCDDREWTLEGITKKPRAKLELTEEGDVIEAPPQPELDLTIDLVASNLQMMEITAANRDAVPSSRKLTPQEIAHWNATVSGLLKTAEQKGYKSGWVVYRLMELKPPMPVWERLGKKWGYKPGWAKHKYAEARQGNTSIGSLVVSTSQ